MDEKEFLGLVQKVAVDSVKNCANGNQDIGALNEVLLEVGRRWKALGGTAEELQAYE